MEKKKTMKKDLFFDDLLKQIIDSIPPTTMAKTNFWRHVIDVEYHKMSEAQRIIVRASVKFSGLFDMEEPDVAMFYGRFDPESQLRVELKTGEILEVFVCGSLLRTSTTNVVDEFSIFRIID